MSSQQTTMPGELAPGEIVEVVKFADLPGRCAELRQAGYHPWRLERMADGYELTACRWPKANAALQARQTARRNPADHATVAGGGADGVASHCRALNAKCE